MSIFKKYNAFLLDWDGCVAKTLHVWMKNYIKLYQKYGVTASEADIIEKSWGNWEKGPENFGIKDSSTFIQELINNIKTDLQTVDLYPGALRQIKKINQNKKKIAIVTSSKKKLVYPAIKYYKMEKYIDCFLSCEDVTKLKPNPEIIKKALNQLKIENKQSIIIGDTIKDVQAGVNANIDTILFFPEQNKKFYSNPLPDKIKPSYQLNEWSSLSQL